MSFSDRIPNGSRRLDIARPDQHADDVAARPEVRSKAQSGPDPVEETERYSRVRLDSAQDAEEERWVQAGREVEGFKKRAPVSPLQEEGGDLRGQLMLLDLSSPGEDVRRG